MSSRLSRSRHHRRFPHVEPRRAIQIAVAALVVLVVLVFGWQAFQTRDALARAAAQADLLQTQLVTADSEGAQRTLRELQASTEDARSASDNVLWSIGARVPLLGRNISAVRTVAAEIDRVADEAAPPVVDLAGQVSSKTFSPTGGTVDLEAIEKVAPAIARSSAALDSSRSALDDVDPEGLLAPLRGPVGGLKYKVDTLASVAGNADLAARLLPDLLGGDGTRRYLLLNQNNAEVRATGGIPGSFAVITAKKGKITLGTQASGVDLRPFDRPVVPLSDDEKATFPSTLGTDIRDVNLTPDFPRSAEIARAMARKGLDVKVDGVISVDPVALSYLLAGTGPVDLGSGVVLTQDNAVAILLHTAYTRLDAVQQDNFFELVNRKIFDAFAAGQGDPATVLSGLVRGVEENRVAFWSAREDEEKAVEATDLGGVFGGDDGSTPHVGVYLNDAASTKMEYFLDQNTSLRSVNCLDGGRQVLSSTTELTSNAPQNAADLTFVPGDGTYVKRGEMRLSVTLFAPYDGAFTSVRLDGKPVGLSAVTYEGRGTARLEVILKPGQTRTITANATSGPDQTADAVFSTTPGIASLRNDYRVPSACGS